MPPVKDPYHPTWFSHSLLESYDRCPKAYEYHYLGVAKGVKGKAALAGIEMHNRIEQGIRRADFSDPIFTEEKVRFIAEKVLGVPLTELCPLKKNNETFLARPRPNLITQLTPELNFGDLNVKLDGMKAFGLCDLVHHDKEKGRLVIVDWKKSDYSRANTQLRRYAALLTSIKQFAGVTSVDIYQHYLEPYRKEEYTDGWILTKKDVKEAEGELKLKLDEIKRNLVLSGKPSEQGCVKCFGGAGCSYKEMCPYAYGKAHEKEWDDLDVPLVTLNEELWTHMGKPLPEDEDLVRVCFALTHKSEHGPHPLKLAAEHASSPVKLAMQLESAPVWCNNWAEALKWAGVAIHHKFSGTYAPLGWTLDIRPNGMLFLKRRG